MSNEGNLKKIIVTDGELKELLINYVGEKLQPENQEVTMEMVIDVLVSEFTELFITVAEENYIRVYESGNINIDGNPVPIREFGDAADSPLGTPLPTQTGIIQNNNGGNGWGIEVVPVITVPDPSPFHLQAIEYEVESS